MPPTDSTPHFDDDPSALLGAIERRAGRIWLRRRLIGASTALVVTAAVVVPAMGLATDDREVVQAAGPRQSPATEPPVTAEPLPPAPSTTTATAAPLPDGPPGCHVTEEARSVEGRHEYLAVLITVGSERTCVGHRNTGVVAINSGRAEATVVQVDWGDGTIDSDPEPAIVCHGPTDTAIKRDRPIEHAYGAEGDYAVVVTVRSVFCTDDGVDEYRVAIDIPFTVSA